jgi:hypothetical protein
MDKLTEEDKRKYFKFWRVVTYELCEGWILDEPTMEQYMPPGEYVYSFAAVLFNGCYRIHARNKVYGNPGAWHCFPEFLKDYAGHVNKPSKPLDPIAVNISEKKSAEQLAKELKRRATTAWAEIAALVIKKNLEVDQAFRRRVFNCTQIAETFQLKVSYDSSTAKNPAVYPDARWIGLYKLETQFDGDFIFRASSVTLEQMIKIMEILRQKEELDERKEGA